MTISRVGSVSAAGSSASLFAHQERDLLFGIAWCENTTPPTVPTGWVRVYEEAATSRSVVVAAKWAESDSASSGTWTNAEAVMFVGYRTNDPECLVVPGDRARAGGTGTTTFRFSSQSLLFVPTLFDIWRVCLGFRTTSSNLASLSHSALTTVESRNITTSEGTIRDSNGTATDWTQQDVVVDTSGNFYSLSIGIYEMETVNATGGGGGYYNPFRNPVFGG